MIRIEEDVYKLIPFFQYGGAIYKAEKIILKETRRNLIHGAGIFSGNLNYTRKLDISVFSGISLSSIFSHSKSFL
jgi:hypothetical protein